MITSTGRAKGWQVRGFLTVAGTTALALAAMAWAPRTAAAGAADTPNLKVRIIQTNSAGDNVDVIDPTTNKVVGKIDGIEVNHGVAVAPDGSHIYVSDEAESTLDVVDGKTLKVVKRISLSGHPNNVALMPDGKRLYVAINETNGGLDVIDTTSMTDIKTIPIKGGIHNPYVTPDGKYAVAGSIVGKTMNIVDTQTNELVWSLNMGLGVRPMTMSKNPDGSTKWIFAQLSDFNGFAVVDFATHKELKRIQNPDLPPGRNTVPEGADPSHGIAVTPDQKTLVVNSRLNNAVYTYSLPDLKPEGTVFLGGKGAAWITLTPDGKSAYVANAVTNDVSVINLTDMKEVARIPVGFVPKRNTTGRLP
jgi:YVTN family beta-propeller protein